MILLPASGPGTASHDQRNRQEFADVPGCDQATTGARDAAQQVKSSAVPAEQSAEKPASDQQAKQSSHQPPRKRPKLSLPKPKAHLSSSLASMAAWSDIALDNAQIGSDALGPATSSHWQAHDSVPPAALHAPSHAAADIVRTGCLTARGVAASDQLPSGPARSMAIRTEAQTVPCQDRAATASHPDDGTSQADSPHLALAQHSLAGGGGASQLRLASNKCSLQQGTGPNGSSRFAPEQGPAEIDARAAQLQQNASSGLCTEPTEGRSSSLAGGVQIKESDSSGQQQGRSCCTDIACGARHSACVTQDGRLFAWGSSLHGQVQALVHVRILIGRIGIRQRMKKMICPVS